MMLLLMEPLRVEALFLVSLKSPYWLASLISFSAKEIVISAPFVLVAWTPFTLY